MNASVTAAEKAAILAHLTAQLDVLGNDPGDWFEELQAAIDNAQIALGRAERALKAGNLDVAQDLVRTVAADLAEAV